MPDPENWRHSPTDDESTQKYLALIRSVHQEWTAREQAGDSSVQLSDSALTSIKQAVRADARHGSHVLMPPTAAGPFTISELALRTLVRNTVDAVPGANTLRVTFEHGPAPSTVHTVGAPVRLACRITAHVGVADLMVLSNNVRNAIDRVCREELNLSIAVIDIHIEDLHAH